MIRRHSTDIVSFVFGAVFLAAGSLLLSDRLNLLADLRWAVPALLIIVALAMFGSLLGRPRPVNGVGDASPVEDARPPAASD
jgi:hypothetical protein